MVSIRSAVRPSCSRSKRGDRIKILVWDRTDLVRVQKRLEACEFVWPKLADGVVRISPAMFTALFEGLDWRLVRPEEARRPQIARSVRQNDSVPSCAWHRQRSNDERLLSACRRGFSGTPCALVQRPLRSGTCLSSRANDGAPAS
ncbi:IS66 family insertion sequence element accessory protein TnpB [Bradyrhizobium sp. USDA 3397]